MNIKSRLRGGLLSLSAAAAFAAQPVAFNMPARDYPAGGSPTAMATGDFNGDGKMDVIVALQTSNQIAVVPGNGSGGFEAPIFSPCGCSGIDTEMAVSDFNGDGKLDVVVSNANGASLTVLLGNGDGTFRAPVNYAVTSNGVAVADFNNDGIPDLVTLDIEEQRGAVEVLLGRGDGTFSPPIIVRFLYQPVGSQSFVVADFNHDGHMDVALVTTNRSNVLLVLLGTGTGSFQQPIVTNLEGYILYSLAAGDLNGDGNPDVAINLTSKPTPQVLTLLGSGDGTFQTPVTLAFAGAVTAIVDMNQDGNLDLVGVGAGDSNALVMLGNGDGTFAGAATSTATGASPVGLLPGFFKTGGATPDLVSANIPGTVSLLLNKGNGTFLAPAASTLPGGATAVATADFNHDGNQDMVTVGQTQVSILLGKGNGAFRKAVNYAAGASPSSVVVGDFNNDGNLDLAVSNLEPANTVSILLGNGDGTFQPAITVIAGGAVPYGTLAAADFNRDGNLDLALTSTSDTVLLLLGKGDGSFKPATTIPVGLTPQFVATADFNHDGNADLVTGGADSIAVLLGNGNGTFQAETLYPVAGADNMFAPAIGDLNDDGNPDLVIPAFSDGDVTPSGVWVLLGNANGSFQASAEYPVGVSNGAVLADFNGDGILDLAIADGGNNDVPVLLGNGDGTFGLPAYFPGGPGVNGVAAADFNHDGKPELAITNTPGVIVLINKTP